MHDMPLYVQKLLPGDGKLGGGFLPYILRVQLYNNCTRWLRNLANQLIIARC